MEIRRALWTAILASACALFAADGAAQSPPGKPVKDAKEAVKDAREKLKEARKDAKEAKDEDKKDAKQGAKDAAKELREARQKLRETRKDRRQQTVQAAKDKWGDLVKKPAVRAELRIHARRTARLNHMESLAKENGKDDLIERIQKLREKENARHDKRMEALKAKGGDE